MTNLPYKKIEHARVCVGNTHMINTRLLDKETSIECLNATMDYYLKENKTFHKSDNYDEIIDELFSIENVHVALTPCEYHFSKSGQYIGEYATITRGGLNERDVIKSVKEYLDKGAVIYLYSFYNLKQDLVNGPLIVPNTNTYYWRMITKIDK